MSTAQQIVDQKFPVGSLLHLSLGNDDQDFSHFPFIRHADDKGGARVVVLYDPNTMTFSRVIGKNTPGFDERSPNVVIIYGVCPPVENFLHVLNRG